MKLNQLRQGLMVSSLLLPISSFAANKTKNPNVLVIIADDLGWGDIGYNNPEHVYTPNLDRLSNAGATFSQHYVMPQSTPTRVSLFTGRYPGRFPYSGKAATNNKCFDLGTSTLATMLKSEGYRTHLSGKWHMGSDSLNGPQFHGFDESYGTMAGACGMYDHRYRPGNYEQTWHRNQKPIKGNEDGVHVTDLMTQEAQRVIRQKSESPFFMMLTYHAPHTPLDERGDFVDQPTQADSNNPARWLNEDKIKWFNDPEGKIQREPDMQKRLLLAAVYHLDEAIGKVVKTLEEEGKLENTIILFSSDNGPQVRWGGKAYPNDLKLENFNQPIPMRGSKLDVYEGGIRVPGFIYWKGKIQPKKVDVPVHIIDWFPTISSIVGHRESKMYKLDGLDLSPVLFKNKELQARDLYWIWDNTINRWALRYGDWKIVKYGKGDPALEDWSLYNLKDDPKEQRNVAKSNPEKLRELHGRFLAQRAKDALQARGAQRARDKVQPAEKRIPERAENPIITHMYTADPTARVWKDGRLYLYPSTDVDPPRGCDLMDGYHVFSTDDLVNWTDHGEILHSRGVEWGRKEGGFMWAPDCVYKKGKYYYYFPHPSGTDWNATWKIGVAVSKKPTSGFKQSGYMKGIDPLIDPNVFIDDDGQAYFYHGGAQKGHPVKGGKLAKNMIEIDGQMQDMVGLEDFHEGPFVFKRNGIYYMIYPDNKRNGAVFGNTMCYATSNHPLGPWNYKGVILDPVGSETSHGSVVEFRGQWYLFYHNMAISGKGNLRSVCFDKLFFNEDGTIQKVIQTGSLSKGKHIPAVKNPLP